MDLSQFFEDRSTSIMINLRIDQIQSILKDSERKLINDHIVKNHEQITFSKIAVFEKNRNREKEQSDTLFFLSTIKSNIKETL